MQWWIEESLKDEQYKKHHNCTKKVTIAKSNYNMNTYNIDNCLQHDKKKAWYNKVTINVLWLLYITINFKLFFFVRHCITDRRAIWDIKDILVRLFI